jgi:hypothetical protein
VARAELANELLRRHATMPGAAKSASASVVDVDASIVVDVVDVDVVDIVVDVDAVVADDVVVVVVVVDVDVVISDCCRGFAFASSSTALVK